MNNNFSPRYHFVRNPAYQVDFTVASSGKRVSGTKRRIRWRFGFSNREAIENGYTGPECRGEEHEVTLVWSLASGKRMVLFDDAEIHYSMGKISQNKFEFDWTMRGNHTMKIIAYAAPPLRAATNFRQFDLLLDGRSVFDLARICDLGGASKTVIPRDNTYERYNKYVNYHLPAQEEMVWAQTIQQHEERRMIDRSASLQSPACAHVKPKFTQSLAPYTDFTMPCDLISEPTPVVEEQDYVSSPLPIIEQNKLDAQYHSSSALNYSLPTTQAPTFEEISGQIMDAYDSSPPQESCENECPELSGALVVSTTGVNSLSNNAIDIKSHKENSPTGVIDATNAGGVFFPQPITPEPKACYQIGSAYNQTNPFDMTPEIAPSESSSISDRPSVESSPSNDPLDNISTKENGGPITSVDELEKSIQKLVNIDDIRSPPEEEMLAKLNVRPYEHPKSQNKISGASRGLPPTPTAWFIGENSTLSEIQSFKSSKTSTVQVMNTYTSNPIAKASVAEGQMVVYGAHNPLIYGPPPISRVSGFGVGTQVTYDDFSMNHQSIPTFAAY